MYTNMRHTNYIEIEYTVCLNMIMHGKSIQMIDLVSMGLVTRNCLAVKLHRNKVLSAAYKASKSTHNNLLKLS